MFSKYKFNKPDIVDEEYFNILKSKFLHSTTFKLNEKTYFEFLTQMERPKNYSDEYYRKYKIKNLGIGMTALQADMMVDMHRITNKDTNMQKILLEEHKVENEVHKNFRFTLLLWSSVLGGFLLFQFLHNETNLGILGLLVGLTGMALVGLTLGLIASSLTYIPYMINESIFYKKLNNAFKNTTDYKFFTSLYKKL